MLVVFGNKASNVANYIANSVMQELNVVSSYQLIWQSRIKVRSN